VSLGFAAILLGLSVDYAMVLYQEAVSAPHLNARQIRHLLWPSIFWAAFTTASAFCMLTLAGLPGLAQLGSLVATGILLAAVVMMFGFLPVVLRHRVEGRPAAAEAETGAKNPRTPGGTLTLTAIIALAALGIFAWKGWQVEHGTKPLEPRNSAAHNALEELDREMNRQGEPLMLLASGDTAGDVARRLETIEERLQQAKSAGHIRNYSLPTDLWPHPHRAQPNVQAAEALFTRMDQMRTAVEEAGFKPEAMALTESVLSFWKSHADSTGAIWPTNQSSRWILKRAAAQIGDQWLAAGMALAPTNAVLPPALTRLHAEDPQIWVTGWPRLSESLLKHVEHRMVWLVIAMAALVTGCLWLAFRRWSDVVLSFAVMGFSFLVLLAVMGLAGWKWNLMSMTAIPLLLGAGVDYTIHIQSALRRRCGDIRGVRKVTGRAVMLCAATTAFGFGSNAFSSNAGLAALGAVCAVGIAITFASAVLLLPAWWVFFHRNELNADEDQPRSNTHEPSTFYRAGLWNAGRTVVRLLPEGVCNWIGRRAASFYGRAHPRRREVVEQNLLPVLDGNQAAAREATRRLYANFGMKIAQLLRCEAGCANGIGGGQWSGWELLSAAIASKRGVLLVTPHLGDWELGGYLLAKRGVRLLVLTQPEPGNGFTELRQQSRARWGIETLVVGQDAFAFVEIIKRLQEGAVVALLLDRPPAPTAVSVELFERPFKASIAAAELARATGCAVLPVYVVHLDRGTEARVLPEIDYDRRALGDRDARRQLTQRIMRAFEPVIKQHADQWYHFVPVWPAKEN